MILFVADDSIGSGEARRYSVRRSRGAVFGATDKILATCSCPAWNRQRPRAWGVPEQDDSERPIRTKRDLAGRDSSGEARGRYGGSVLGIFRFLASNIFNE
jgi:hypothetical protein